MVRLFLTKNVDAAVELPGGRGVVRRRDRASTSSWRRSSCIFAFTQGVFPKPPDFSDLNAFDLSYFAQHPKFTLFVLTALAVPRRWPPAIMSARVRAFWAARHAGPDDPVRPAPLLPRGLRRPVRRLAVPLHRVLVPARGVQRRRVGEERAAGPGRATRSRRRCRSRRGGAGVQQALLVKVFAGGRRRRPSPPTRSASRSRSPRSRSRVGFVALAIVFRMRIVQGGHAARPRGPRAGTSRRARRPEEAEAPGRRRSRCRSPRAPRARA